MLAQIILYFAGSRNAAPSFQSQEKLLLLWQYQLIPRSLYTYECSSLVSNLNRLFLGSSPLCRAKYLSPIEAHETRVLME